MTPIPDASPRARLDAASIERLYREARAERWGGTVEAFARALEASAARAPADTALERYLSSLHLADLALACACAEGRETAWDHFVREHRRLLYRAADALAPGGAARELADSLYAELYGITEHGDERRSLFRYFHGRSTLGTWLRAVLAQRFVDRFRSGRRLEPLPDDETAQPRAPAAPDPDLAPCAELIERALATAVAKLPARDRLRLASYYTQGLTLAQIGRLLSEHEATVSRQLARTRKTIRREIEQDLREAGLAEDAISQCFERVAQDSGTLDLNRVLPAGPRKNSARDRSS